MRAFTPYPTATKTYAEMSVAERAKAHSDSMREILAAHLIKKAASRRNYRNSFNK
jgi:hypothetical protein